MTDAAGSAQRVARSGGGERAVRGRIAVLFEPGRNGVAALARASELATTADAELTVVVLAPQATGERRCGPSPAAFNCAVLDAARAELDDAARLLVAPTEGVRFTLLIEGTDPPLPSWLAAGGYDEVLVPARRRVFGARRHPAMRQLRRLSGCHARVVASR